MQQRFAVIGIAVVLVVVLGPLLFGSIGWLRNRRAGATTDGGMRWDWRLTFESALLYALAFNLVFFLQELFLVVPKALTPGLRPTLFHNNHRWDGEHPLAALFQGTGALAIFTTGLLFALWLTRRPGRSIGGRLFCLWMAYQGLYQALPQAVIGAVHPGNDVGMAMDYFALGPVAKTVIALWALLAMPLFARWLLPQWLALAPARIERASARAGFVFATATLPACIGTLLVLPFRVPGHIVEVAMVPLIVMTVGIGWIQAGAWSAPAVPSGGLRPVRTVWPALLALVVVLAVFHLVLRPGIAF